MPLDTLPNMIDDGEEEGSAFMVPGLDPEPVEEETDEATHPQNLVEFLSEEDQSVLARQVIDELRIDRESRQQWDEMLAEGIEQLGFDRSKDDKTEPFPGAASLNDPVLAQSVVDIQARLMRELMPAKGPVSTQIIGRETPQKKQQAARIELHMNYQLLIECPEFRPQMDLAMMLLPVAGSAIKKVFWDATLNRVRSEYLSPQDFIVPYHAKDLETAPRYTQIMEMTAADIKRSQAAGFWADIPLGVPSVQTDEQESRVEETTNRIQGEEDPERQDTATYKVFESHRDVDIESLRDMEDSPPEFPLPYIVTVDESTQKILSIRRNWREGDTLYRKRIWYSHYKFMPWLGFYGIGLVHLIGGLSRACTGASRAIMDAAMIATIPGGLRLKGSRVSAGTLEIRPMEFTPLEAPPGVTDINKVAMPYPVRPSDPALFSILEFEAGRAEKFANVATQAIQDANPNGAVGTTLALIEQGSIVYSGIHQRQHATFGQELRMLAELNGEWLDDNIVVKTFGGEAVISRRDYTSDVDVIPVSDPSIFSHAQRAAKAQAKWELSKAAKEQGVNVDMRAAAVDVADTLGMDDAEQLFPAPQQAQPLDPVSEFAAIVASTPPVKAFPGQDHNAHVQFLMAKGQDPINAPIMQTIGAPLQALIADHLVAQQRDEIMAMLQQQFRGQQPPPHVMEQAMAQAASMVSQQRVHQQQMQAQQQAQQPQDALAAVAMEDVKRKAADDQTKATLAAAKLKTEAAQSHMQSELDAAKLAADTEKAHLQSQLDAAKLELQKANDERDAALEAQRVAAEDARTAAQDQTKAGIEAARIASAEKIAFAKMANDREMQDAENADDLEKSKLEQYKDTEST